MPLDFIIRRTPDVFLRCGAVVASCRTEKGRGPYYCLAYGLDVRGWQFRGLHAHRFPRHGDANPRYWQNSTPVDQLTQPTGNALWLAPLQPRPP